MIIFRKATNHVRKMMFSRWRPFFSTHSPKRAENLFMDLSKIAAGIARFSLAIAAVSSTRILVFSSNWVWGVPIKINTGLHVPGSRPLNVSSHQSEAPGKMVPKESFTKTGRIGSSPILLKPYSSLFRIHSSS